MSRFTDALDDADREIAALRAQVDKVMMELGKVLLDNEALKEANAKLKHAACCGETGHD